MVARRLKGARREDRRRHRAVRLSRRYVPAGRQWFFAPLSEEQIDALASQDLRGLAEEDGSPYADGYNDLYRALRLRHTGTRQALAADFTGVFYGATTEGGQTAQPFESLYRCDGGALMGESRGEVYRTPQEGPAQSSRGPRFARRPSLVRRGL